MDKKTFDFYHIVKNEDAYTYSYQTEEWGFIVAADGLGGSGSTLHVLKEEQMKDLESRLKAAALPEYFCDACREEVFEDTVDEAEDTVEETEEASADETYGESEAASAEETADDPAEEAVTEAEELSVCESEAETHCSAEDAPADLIITVSGPDVLVDTIREKVVETFRNEEQSPAYDVDSIDAGFGPWVDKLLEPMLDGTPDTSALWGSRVAIMRFVHYMLSRNVGVDLQDEDTRRDIVDYIYRGLEATRDAFGLTAGELSGQCVLPTTLVCMRYMRDDDGTTLVEAVWAGDSRGYALIPEIGMKQITVDDEDDSGAINNLFALRKTGERMETELHYVYYRLPAKCALFVCSDGVFDPYAPIDNLGVEETLLTALEDAVSYEDLGRRWYEQYQPMRHDDTTVSFAALDLPDFQEFKSSLISRHTLVKQAMDGFVDGFRVYQMLMDDGAKPDEYVIKRANTCRARIAGVLSTHVAATDPAETSPLVTEALRNALENEIRAVFAAPICERLMADLTEEPKRAETILRNARFKKPVLSDAVQRYLQAAERINREKRRASKRERYMADASVLIARLEERRGILKGMYDRFQQMQEEVEKITSTVDVLFDGFDPSNSDMNKILNAQKNFYNNRCTCTKDAIRSIDRILRGWDAFVREGNADEFAGVGCVEMNLAICKSNAGAPRNDNQIASPLKLHPPKTPYCHDHLLLYPMDAEIFEQLKKLYLELMKIEIDASASHDRDAEANIAALTEAMKEELSVMMKDPRRHFTDEAVAAYGMDALDGAGASDTVKPLAEKILTTDDEVFRTVVDVFLTCKESTIIDSFFNASQLATYREYVTVDHDKVISDHDRAMELLDLYENMTAYAD